MYTDHKKVFTTDFIHSCEAKIIKKTVGINITLIDCRKQRKRVKT